eukprot:GHVP01054863.1.p1 GENE.GHVP01054863.1~~GHVP01054863.1.p1  ORF type:complete len:391 (+),score=47.00 GHVP01054863.1:51-1175(+)
MNEDTHTPKEYSQTSNQSDTMFTSLSYYTEAYTEKQYILLLFKKALNIDSNPTIKIKSQLTLGSGAIWLLYYISPSNPNSNSIDLDELTLIGPFKHNLRLKNKLYNINNKVTFKNTPSSFIRIILNNFINSKKVFLIQKGYTRNEKAIEFLPMDILNPIVFGDEIQELTVEGDWYKILFKLTPNHNNIHYLKISIPYDFNLDYGNNYSGLIKSENINSSPLVVGIGNRPDGSLLELVSHLRLILIHKETVVLENKAALLIDWYKNKINWKITNQYLHIKTEIRPIISGAYYQFRPGNVKYPVSTEGNDSIITFNHKGHEVSNGVSVRDVILIDEGASYVRDMAFVEKLEVYKLIYPERAPRCPISRFFRSLINK